ncbi:C4-dicarboxylate ABC transporter substrate-binding protein [Mesorhizobium sp. L-8-10]|uniref:TRAP transporter small permease n=1 Tax=Mesorhizobium sp. L-8-10 TaxID=2744523 RepID=UPI0019261A47|nr:TRAP transporter small permease [Mesorhizobium sp. L-8-10]BCH28545.1 C4-dicarboxylate ABC transporter substrate-binding protein [Mesorhizobium sp. L-8-10]
MSGEPATHEEARRVSSLLQGGAKVLSRIGGALSAALILIVLAVTFVSVFNRYVLGKPIMGVDEGTGFLVVAIVMFGAAEALRRGDHIRIDLLFDHAGPRLRWHLELWSLASVILFSALLLVAAWHTVLFSRAFGAYSTGYLSVPMWIPQSTMVVGALLLIVAALAALLEHITGRRT